RRSVVTWAELLGAPRNSFWLFRKSWAPTLPRSTASPCASLRIVCAGLYRRLTRSLAWSSVVPYTACRGAQSKQLVAVSKEPESFAALCSYRRQKLVVIKHLYPTALRKQLAAVSAGPEQLQAVRSREMSKEREID
ncbi:hypothetical protein ACEPT3_29165, partial [Pseudomonas paraeruginosa]